MPQADLLVDLLRSGTEGDQITFRKAAEALIEDERSKGHRVLATRLVKSLQPNVIHMNHTVSRPHVISAQHRDLFFQTTPERALESLVLPVRTQAQLEDRVTADLREPSLAHIGCPPTSRFINPLLHHTLFS